ncbi:hypothetical protein FKW77_005366 [Venturia effusa]|uniref:Uncharacterized protein n=1 Tax=Venturia effusa TaxID=50376 RepID=A0A517LLJ1_9PEZI|nr:hypothetical protein FKW77_005366 [Venturia effusa]
MAEQPPNRDLDKSKQDHLRELSRDSDGLVAPPRVHMTSINSATSADQNGINQGAQPDSSVNPHTSTTQGVEGSHAHEPRTTTSLVGEGAGMFNTTSTKNAPSVPDDQELGRGINETVESTHDDESTQAEDGEGDSEVKQGSSGLPSGHHPDAAIRAIHVQPHLAKGLCWRCRDNCKVCNWQHPLEHCHLKRWKSAIGASQP